MAVVLTATVVPATWSVSLVVTGGTPANLPYVVTASPAGGLEEYVVRGAPTVVVVAGGYRDVFLVDGDAPLNVPVTYTVRDALGATVSASPVTVPATRDVLGDARDPLAVVPVTVWRQLPNVWDARTRTWDVLEREDPFVSIAPLRLRSGDLQLRVSVEERRALLDLLRTGSPLRLRSVSPLAVDDAYLAVSSVREDLVLDDLPAGPRLFTLSAQAVSRELGPTAVDSTRTYVSFLADAGSYDELRAAFATYGDARAGRFR